MADRIKHHKNYKNCCRRRQPSWYDRLSIIHTTEDFHIRSDCNEAHRTYWIRYQSQPFPKGLQITTAPAIHQFSTWADLLAHSFLPPSIKVFLGPVLNQHSNVLRLYFLEIWIPSDFNDSKKITSFFEKKYFLFFFIFFKKLLTSFSIFDFA